MGELVALFAAVVPTVVVVAVAAALRVDNGDAAGDGTVLPLFTALGVLVCMLFGVVFKLS